MFHNLYLFHNFSIFNVIFNYDKVRIGDHTQDEEWSVSSRIDHLILNGVTAEDKNIKIKQKTQPSPPPPDSAEPESVIMYLYTSSWIKLYYKNKKNLSTLLNKAALVLPVWEVLCPFLMTIREVMQSDGRFLKHCHILHQILHSDQSSRLEAEVKKRHCYSTLDLEQCCCSLNLH